MNYYNIQNSEQTYTLLDSQLENPKLYYSMTVDNFENTQANTTENTMGNTIETAPFNQVNSETEIKVITVKSEELSDNLEDIVKKPMAEVSQEDLTLVNTQSKVALDLLEEEIKKALASVDTFANVAVKTVYNIKNNFIKNNSDNFENTDLVNNISQINEVTNRTNEMTNKIENMNNNSNSKKIYQEADVLETEIQKALDSIELFSNLSVQTLLKMENKLIENYSEDVSEENDYIQELYLKTIAEENKIANYLNNNERVIENFGIGFAVTAGKIAAKAGSIAAKAAKVIAKAGKIALKFAAKHPKLVATGVGLAAVGIYAASTKQTFGGAAQDLAKKGTEELKNVAQASSAVVGTVAGGVISAAGSVVGNVGGGLIEGITGIKKEDQWMIWWGIGSIILLIIVWKIYSMLS